MPAGYVFMPQPNDVASAVLGKCDWAVLALTLHIEIFTQVHYRASIEPDAELSELWKDVFLFHWKEESQHAILDELEWRREDARITQAERDAGRHGPDRAGRCGRRHRAGAGQADARLLHRGAPGRQFTAPQKQAIRDAVLKAYRWQYVVSGAQEPRFGGVLAELVTRAQMERIGAALGPIVAHVAGPTH